MINVKASQYYADMLEMSKPFFQIHPCCYDGHMYVIVPILKLNFLLHVRSIMAKVHHCVAMCELCYVCKFLSLVHLTHLPCFRLFNIPCLISLGRNIISKIWVCFGICFIQKIMISFKQSSLRRNITLS